MVPERLSGVRWQVACEANMQPRNLGEAVNGPLTWVPPTILYAWAAISREMVTADLHPTIYTARSPRAELTDVSRWLPAYSTNGTSRVPDPFLPSPVKSFSQEKGPYRRVNIGTQLHVARSELPRSRTRSSLPLGS